MKPVRRLVSAVAAALVLTSCGSGSSSSPSGDGSAMSASPSHSVATGSQTAAPSPSQTSAGSPEHPVAVSADEAPLDWRNVPGPTKDVVTVGDGWTLTVAAGGATARLAGPHPRVIRAGDHATITDAFLDHDHALIVSEDRLASDPDRATLVDLATGRLMTLDEHSSPPTVVGGTWALGPDTLVHATSGSGHRYCLATVALATGEGSTGWCAPARHGFSRATITSSATTMMTFDDHHPSCRSLVEVEGSDVVPIPGVTACKGWDSALSAPGAVWSIVPKERRIEAAHFYAHDAAGWYDLGPGASGSLVTCAGSSFFTRDPSSRSEPARLMRWAPDTRTLTIAYQSRATGNAFLSPPRCGGTHLTVTAYSQAGDEQVTTSLG